ncbi:hypothetical protein PGIGA_G00121620 [Pangasianodon gigas]|uniref:Uncharacterized protein n=1 Tax=Pangasianodon gigas TaxID=30993 RepID=A0ACC5XGI1_PANGG|nr:hypothetical protein [Pangasianodon gigas]
MHGTAEVLFMDVDYRVTDMQIQDVELPTSAVSLVPGTGVSLSITNAYISVRGKWHVEYLFIDDDGWFDLAIRGLSITATIAVNNDGSGHPMVSTAYCTSSIGQVDITLHGGLSWLYQLFDGYINSALLDALRPQGEFYNIGQHKEPPFSPTPISLPAQGSKMMYIALSAFTLNSAGFVYNNAGVLKLYVTDDMIPSSFPFRLDTKTFGKLIPQIAKQYPGLMMKLLVKAVKEPNISFEPNNMTMQAISTVTAYAIQPNATLTPLFVLNVNASVSALIYVSGLRVAGNLTLNKIDMTLGTSYVGPFQVESLNNVFKTILTAAVIPKVNARLQQGYPLPAIGKMNLLNTQLQILKDYVLIGTDVQFMGLDLPDVL